MWMAVGIIGFLGFIVLGIMALISVFKKNGKAKRNLLYSGILFVLFIVGMANNPASDSTDKVAEASTSDVTLAKADAIDADKQTKADEDKQKQAEEEKKKQEEAAAKEAKAKKKADENKPVQLGTAAQVGKLIIQVNKAGLANKLGTNQYLQKETQEQFVVINVSIKNGDTESRTIDTSMFKLIDPDGIKYEPLSDGDMYINDSDNMLFLAQVNPKITKTANVAFEVPKDSKSFVLSADSGVMFKATKSKLFALSK